MRVLLSDGNIRYVVGQHFRFTAIDTGSGGRSESKDRIKLWFRGGGMKNW